MQRSCEQIVDREAGRPVMSENLADDISPIGQIEAVSRILEVVCRTTGLGFSAVTRLTESRWIDCSGHLVVPTFPCGESTPESSDFGGSGPELDREPVDLGGQDEIVLGE